MFFSFNSQWPEVALSSSSQMNPQWTEEDIARQGQSFIPSSETKDCVGESGAMIIVLDFVWGNTSFNPLRPKTVLGNLGRCSWSYKSNLPYQSPRLRPRLSQMGAPSTTCRDRQIKLKRLKQISLHQEKFSC